MHHIVINEKFQERPWGAIEIVEYCDRNHIPVPQHFSYLWKDRFQYISEPELVEDAENEDESLLFINFN